MEENRKLHSHGFFILSDSLREVEEVKIAMIAFARDFDIPRALRRHTSSSMPQTTTEIPSCIILFISGKEYSTFQAEWRQSSLSLKTAAFVVRGISRFQIDCLQEGPFTLKDQGVVSVVGGIQGRVRGSIRRASYFPFVGPFLSQWGMLSNNDNSLIGDVGGSSGPSQPLD